VNDVVRNLPHVDFVLFCVAISSMRDPNRTLTIVLVLCICDEGTSFPPPKSNLLKAERLLTCQFQEI